jgi:ribokinase
MKALTIGGAMIDTTAIIESDHIERMSMLNAETSFLLIEEGRKTESLEVSTHCGGGAINTAVAMARLGADVATLIKVGEDDRAEMILERLSEQGISPRWVMRDAQAPTGASVLISSHERNAAVFTFRGVNTLLTAEDLDNDAFAVDLVYVSNLSNESADCFPQIVEKAKANGALLAVNPGLRQLSARSGAFQSCLSQIDILTINRPEADILVTSLVSRFGEGGQTLALEPGEKPPELLARGLVGGGFAMSLPAFLDALRQLGTKHIVLTDSRSGAFVCSNGEILFCAALDAEVAGTAGAGDAFASTFATYIALGQPSDTALKAATINAASVVGHVDTQTGLLSRLEIEKRLAAQPGLSLRRWAL